MKITPLLTTAKIALLATAGTWMVTPTASAILIDFESGNGYSTTGGTGGFGNLQGQPSSGTTWTHTTDSSIRVTANAGTTGTDQAIVANNTGGVGGGDFYSFNPSNTDLGGTFDSASSKISFSLDYKLLERSTQTAVGSFRIGSTGSVNWVLNMNFFTDGKIYISYGAGGGFSKTTTGGATDFQAAANTYYSIVGEIDYATKTYTLSINGVPQSDASSSTDLGFRGTPTSASLNLTTINHALGTWKPFAIDNISYTAVPEPSTTALTLLFMGIVAIRFVKRRAVR